MPELPEVETVRRALAQHCCGQTLSEVMVRTPTLRMPVNGNALSGLCGLPLQGVERRGKFLKLLFPGRTLVCHLGMSGRFFLDRSGTEDPPHSHVVFVFTSGLRLLFVDPRRFGIVWVVDGDGSSFFSALGPEPADTPSVQQSLFRVKKSQRNVRNVLLDQSVVAGVGNIYANEALFVAGIRPQTPMVRLSPQRIARLAQALKEVVARAVEAGGTTLRDGSFRGVLGEPGYFAVSLAVYGREGEPCPRCGTSVRRELLTGRSAYFCPSCQR